MSPRRTITKAMKAMLMINQNGLCKCGGKLSLGSYHVDHMVPLALGGADDLSNMQALCIVCHKEKTVGRGATTHGSDIGNISKTKRLEKIRLGTAKQKPKKIWPKRELKSRSTFR